MLDELAGQNPLKLQAATPTGAPGKGWRQANFGSGQLLANGDLGIVAHLADTELVVGFRIRLIFGAPAHRFSHSIRMCG